MSFNIAPLNFHKPLCLRRNVISEYCCLGLASRVVYLLTGLNLASSAAISENQTNNKNEMKNLGLVTKPYIDTRA